MCTAREKKGILSTEPGKCSRRTSCHCFVRKQELPVKMGNLEQSVQSGLQQEVIHC